jgi:broad specificity phosphatase PhoE
VTRLILVRHAMPEIVPGVASSLWGLSGAAREDCVILAHRLALPPGGCIFSSSERRASETADVLALRLGREVVVDDAFGEVDRPWEDGDYGDRAGRYLAGDAHPGWEPRPQVVERFSRGVDRAAERTSGADIVIVTHGQALSLYLASRTSIDVVAFWRALTLPDAWTLDLTSGQLSRLYETGRPPANA